MRHLRLLMALAIAAPLWFAVAASADIHIVTSNTAPRFGPGEALVTLIPGDTGTTVHGTISNPAAVVDFTSITDVLVNAPTNGTPSVRAEDNSINNLSITIPGFTFTDAIFDVYGVYAVHPELTITANANDGTVTQSFMLNTGQTSRNWITVLATNNETITSISLTDAKFYSLEGLHISGAESPVPEPATLALVFSGLLGAGSRLRKVTGNSRKETL